MIGKEVLDRLRSMRSACASAKGAMLGVIDVVPTSDAASAVLEDLRKAIANYDEVAEEVGRPKVLKNPRECQHAVDFDAAVVVNKLKDSGQWMVDLRIRCAECGRPFAFLGLRPGLDMNGAACSVDGQEARLSLRPVGEEAPVPVAGVPSGFIITSQFGYVEQDGDLLLAAGPVDEQMEAFRRERDGESKVVADGQRIGSIDRFPFKVECRECGRVAILPVVEGVIPLGPVDDWHFSLESGWTCPGHGGGA